jgi:hypothetical protein
MGAKADIAYHDFLDDLCERGVFAKVVMKIEGGVIKEVIESYTHKPGEILRKYPLTEEERRRPKVITVKRTLSGAAAK